MTAGVAHILRAGRARGGHPLVLAHLQRATFALAIRVGLAAALIVTGGILAPVFAANRLPPPASRKVSAGAVILARACVLRAVAASPT